MAKVELDVAEMVEETFEKHFGVTLDRLRELAEADKDGRCVVLPCKAGDTVNTKYGKGEVVAWDTTARVKILDEPDFMKRYRDFDIGSKVFTRAEADAALSEQEEHNETDRC